MKNTILALVEWAVFLACLVSFGVILGFAFQRVVGY